MLVSLFMACADLVVIDSGVNHNQTDCTHRSSCSYKAQFLSLDFYISFAHSRLHAVRHSITVHTNKSKKRAEHRPLSCSPPRRATPQCSPREEALNQETPFIKADCSIL